jgi:hypothetical protein
MTSKERVIKAVKFQGPDRIPYNLPEKWGTDLLEIWMQSDPNFKPKVNSETDREDEWGCIWRKLPGDKTMGQVVYHPLSDYSKLKNFKFPDFSLEERYTKLRQMAETNKNQKFILFGVPISFMHIPEYLRGHQELWTDPYLNPKEVHHLFDILSNLAILSVEKASQIGVDGIFSCDDLGHQDRSIVSAEIFKKFYKPYFKKVYSFAHKKGLLTFLHSCGCITDLLDDLIDAELDVIQMDQQENMGLENLSKRFGGRICFWCPVDIQKTMIEGNVEDIRRYAKKLIWSFGRFNGGFIGRWYSAPEAVQHSQEKIDAMSEIFIKFGKYPLERKEYENL